MNEPLIIWMNYLKEMNEEAGKKETKQNKKDVLEPRKRKRQKEESCQKSRLKRGGCEEASEYFFNIMKMWLEFHGRNWRKLEEYQEKWRKFWIKIKRNFRGMDYFCGINNLNEMDLSKANIKEKMESE